MIQPIVLYGDPRLRQKCSYYEKNTDLTQIIQDLWDTMYNANGTGIAAPQIGELTRIFVVHHSDLNFKEVFINPTIIKYSKETSLMSEGCLSIPNLEAPIERPSKILMEWYDEKWEHHSAEFDGIKSRIIQHEYDHLEGILWLDRAELKYTISMLSDLKKCYSREIQIDYPFI